MNLSQEWLLLLVEEVLTRKRAYKKTDASIRLFDYRIKFKSEHETLNISPYFPSLSMSNVKF